MSATGRYTGFPFSELPLYLVRFVFKTSSTDLGSLPDVPGVEASGADFGVADFSDFSAAAFAFFAEVEIFGVTVMSSSDKLFELEEMPFLAIIIFLSCLNRL